MVTNSPAVILSETPRKARTGGGAAVVGLDDVDEFDDDAHGTLREPQDKRSVPGGRTPRNAALILGLKFSHSPVDRRSRALWPAGRR